MTRLTFKSTVPLAFLLGLAFAVPAATIAQAQGSRDPASSRNLNDPANARNLNDTQDPNRSRLNDPANARNLNTDQQDPNVSRDADPKKKKSDQ